MDDLVQTLADIKKILDALTKSDIFRGTQYCHERIYKTLVNGYNYIYAVIQKKVKLEQEQGIIIYFLHHLKKAEERFKVEA